MWQTLLSIFWRIYFPKMAATMVAFARKYEIRFLVDRGLDVRMQIVLDFGFSHFYLSIIEPPPLNLSLSLSLPLYYTHTLTISLFHTRMLWLGGFLSSSCWDEKSYFRWKFFQVCVCVCACAGEREKKKDIFVSTTLFKHRLVFQLPFSLFNKVPINRNEEKSFIN